MFYLSKIKLSVLLMVLMMGMTIPVFFKIVDTLRLNFTLPFPYLHQAHYLGSTLLRRLVHSF